MVGCLRLRLNGPNTIPTVNTNYFNSVFIGITKSKYYFNNYYFNIHGRTKSTLKVPKN